MASFRNKYRARALASSSMRLNGSVPFRSHTEVTPYAIRYGVEEFRITVVHGFVQKQIPRQGIGFQLDAFEWQRSVPIFIESAEVGSRQVTGDVVYRVNTGCVRGLRG